MNSIDNYTVTQILEKYKDIIGTDIEKVINTVLYQDRIIFKQAVDNKMAQYEDIKDRNEYLRIRNHTAYKEVYVNFYLNEKANNNKDIKLALFCDIYRRFSKKMLPKEVEKIKKIILGKNPFAIFKYNSDEYPEIYDYEFIMSEKQEKLSSIKNLKLKELLESYFSEISLESDINSFMKKQYSDDLYKTILNKLLIKFFLYQNRMSPREYKEHLLKGDFLDNALDKDENLKKGFEKELKEFFADNLQLMNKETLLYNLAAKNIIGIKVFKGEEINGLELKEDNINRNKGIECFINSLREIYSVINDKKYRDVKEFTIHREDGSVLISLDRNYIKNFLDKCTKTEYLSEADIDKIHKDILEGVLVEDIEKRKIADINLEDLINSSDKFEEKEKDSPEREKMLRTNIELAQYLLSEGKTTEQELLDMYLQGKFDAKLISNINMPEFTEEYYNNKLKELYYQMVFSQETEDSEKNLQRFAMLYTELEKTGKINCNKDQLISDITMFFGEDFICPILSDLQELDIITLEKGLEWIGTDIFIEQYKRGKLKPQEVRKFYDQNREKNLNDIIRIINKLPDNGEKFMVIGSIFPEETEEDKEIRDLLFDECLKIDTGISNVNQGNKRKEGQNNNKDYYKHITDPFARISLIKALDKDYSFKMTEDGHAIVRLPNMKSVIIEKMLDKDRQPSYGAATYILDEDYYDTNEIRIKKHGKINRQEIIKDTKTNEVIRIIHSAKNWGLNIKEYFLKSKKAQWSKEEETAIDETIKRVKRSDPIFRENQKLAKMILNLIFTRNATLEQIEQMADIYGVDLEKIMNTLDERDER